MVLERYVKPHLVGPWAPFLGFWALCEGQWEDMEGF